MYSYTWDIETGGILLNSTPAQFSKEPRPVYYQELDILGFDKYWNYAKDDSAPYMWAEANNYYYRGRLVAQTKGGSALTKPEIIIVDSPEGPKISLRLVNIQRMIEKNIKLLDIIESETIKKIYNTYRKYKKKIDLFYVAFSGGKDSILAFDLVQRAIPHSEFKVLFGDTQMEFSDTYDLISKFKETCKQKKIDFLMASSKMAPQQTWRLFGPPAQKLRWCCSVHKTTPQILLLRRILGNPQFKGMAFTGVRAAESAARAEYEDISLGDKIRGQYSFHPILEWNTAELFLYSFRYDLPINEAYKYGNSRVGCLVCPLSGHKNMYIKEQLYGNPKCPNSTAVFNNIIMETTSKCFTSKEAVDEFINIAGWKARRSGRELRISQSKIFEKEESGVLYISTVKNQYWKEWIKTVCKYNILNKDLIALYIGTQQYQLHIKEQDDTIQYEIKIGNTKEEIQLKKALKIALRKSAYCIKCQVCEANCPYGFIQMDDNGIFINEDCYKCHKCHDIDDGCLLANSNRLPKTENKMGSVNRYANLGVEFDWIKKFSKHLDNFWDNNELGTNKIKVFKSFLSDSNIIAKGKVSPFGSKIMQIGVDTESAWGLVVLNLIYTAQFNWWIKNIQMNAIYTPDMIKAKLTEESINVQSHIVSAFKNIFISNQILGKKLGLGVCDYQLKSDKRYLNSIHRTRWENPDPRVVLYGLFKFAEACDNYYQFTLTDLLNDSIERDGISPTRVFGIGREEMINILNGLTINYPDFISASFTLDLDSISLRNDKTSEDVLELF